MRSDLRPSAALPFWVILVCLLADRPASAEVAPRREPVGPFLGGALPARAPIPSGDWVTVKAFPRLTFEDPVGLVAGPGASNTLYVCGRQGVIWAFENDPNASTKTVFLDIQARCQGWDDGGLLGLAFHPRFGQPGAKERGYFYVWYTYSERPNPGPGRPPNGKPTFNRLARFTVPDGSAVADPNSELVLIDQLDENTYHNGGGMFFHPVDGFLYLSLGDEGGDSGGNTQRIDRDLFSGVIRIDVDCRGGTISHAPHRKPETGQTGHYFIPNDNPWVGLPGVLEEFWCVGLRSPHRMTHDAESGRTWVGDVGESTREEVDVIERGGNYQWGFREGTAPGPQGKPANVLGVEKPPIFDYGRDQGNAVIGGHVYRGSEHAAALGGKYIFGDNNGRVWALTYDKDKGPPRAERLCELPQAPSRAYGLGLSSFGVDRAGELYLCQLGNEGQIYRLARKGGHDTAPGATFPNLLSQTGAFRDVRSLTPAPFMIPYEVNAPLWSDGAAKSRWVVVPNDGPPYGPGERVGFSEAGDWAFPDGTVFVKHFEIAADETRSGKRRRLETRFLVRSAGGGVHGATYRWREDHSDAELVGEDGRVEDVDLNTPRGVRRQTWQYPSRRECLSCHTAAAGYVLGVKTRQLNRDVNDSGNQLRAWGLLGLLEPAPAVTEIPGMPRLVAVNETRASLEERVRSYLDANCAHCHRPGGVRASFDARYDAPETARGVIDGAVANPLGMADARVIAPGAPGRSVAYKRMTSQKASERMPPLASSVVDADASAALREWIKGLPASPRVNLTRPSDRLVVKAGAEVTVEAQVIAGAGSVRGVDFYRGGDPIGEASGRPYRVVWKAEAAGSYALTARVRDDRGASATSAAVLVTVVEPSRAEEPAETGRVDLADLPWAEASSGWGPVERDRSNGDKGAGDGGPIRLNGKSYARGLGVHAGSVVRYRLNGRYASFRADVGVDDEVGDGGSVVFQVWADGSKLFDSGLMTGRSPSRPVRVDVSRRDELALVVTDGGDGNSSDHADWADARLIPADGRARK